MAKHFLLHSFGSLGDLHPFIALGLGLEAKGHKASIATSESYRNRVEQTGLGFYPIRPNINPNDPALLKKIMHPNTGTQYVFKELTLPHLKETYKDLSRAASQADALISSTITFAAPIVAETTNIPWISTVFAPVSFFSAHDPSVLNLPLNNWVSKSGPYINQKFFNIGKTLTDPWAKPLYEYRKSLGLQKGQNPFFDGQHSPRCALALFSSHFAAPQTDWPQHSQATGFVFYDAPEQNQNTALEDFLNTGEAAIVFTLGSAAVYAAGDFYLRAAQTAQQLGCRAVLLVGKNEQQQLPKEIPKNIFVTDYAPYSQIFPKAAAIVHQGGIGTTAQALRAGKPSLVMPFAHDQFDNGLRIKRIGAGQTIPKQSSAKKMAATLEEILGNTTTQNQAEKIGHIIQTEPSVENAVAAILAAI